MTQTRYHKTVIRDSGLVESTYNRHVSSQESRVLYILPGLQSETENGRKEDPLIGIYEVESVAGVCGAIKTRFPKRLWLLYGYSLSDGGLLLGALLTQSRLVSSEVLIAESRSSMRTTHHRSSSPKRSAVLLMKGYMRLLAVRSIEVACPETLPKEPKCLRINASAFRYSHTSRYLPLNKTS